MFPRGFDTKALGQARRNSADLARELSALTAEPIIVNAVLTLPGWFVNRKGKSDVNVLNPQEIRQAVISNEKPVLSPAQLQRIGNHLDQKCRDVEL